jgi:membrane protease subunit HflK
MLGGRAVRLYLGSILIVALTAGLMLDLLAPGVAAVHIGVPPDEFASLALVKLVAAFVFGMLLLASLQRTGLRSGWHQLAENGSAVLRWARSVSLKDARRTLALRVVVALWLVSLLAGTFWRVPIGQQALVQRLGRLVGPPRGAGPAFVAPFTDRIDLVAVDEMRERAIGYRLRPGTLVREPLLDEALHLTADENVVDLRAEAQYRVRDAVRYRLGVEAPDDVLAALARARLVEAMAGRPIDSVYTDTRAAVERWLLRRVRHDAEMAHLGIEVVAVRLLDVHAPAAVHDAFRDVASAHEDRLTTIHLANEYAASIVAVGRGDAARITAEAEGFAAERRARAKGDANAFAALATAHRQSPRATEDRLYIEAAERVLPGARKIVRPAGGTAASVDLWLRGGPSAELFPSSPPETVVEGSGSTAKEWSPWPKEHRQ